MGVVVMVVMKFWRVSLCVHIGCETVVLCAFLPARTLAGGSSCLTRNPVTGDGVDITPVRRSARRCRDGNPVTGTGYAEAQNNGPAVQNGTTSSTSSEKSNDTSPAGKVQSRTRVPPGGYSSGLW